LGRTIKSLLYQSRVALRKSRRMACPSSTYENAQKSVYFLCIRTHLKLLNLQSYDIIWDPNSAMNKGIFLEHKKDVISSFPYHLREAALLELSRLDYNMSALRSTVLKPSNGQDWSNEQKDKFHAEIFRFRRNLPAVAKSMKIPLGTCQAYYLGTYKSSMEYLLLKTICIDERNSRGDESQKDSDVCAICGDGGSLIICDGCEGEYHMNCLNPPLRNVPAGHWLCDECVDAKALEARDILLERSQFFEKVSSNVGTMRKRSSNELQTDTSDRVPSPITSSDALKKHHPSQQFINAVSACSLKIDEILRSPFD
jgi:PHD-finger